MNREQTMTNEKFINNENLESLSPLFPQEANAAPIQKSGDKAPSRVFKIIEPIVWIAAVLILAVMAYCLFYPFMTKGQYIFLGVILILILIAYLVSLWRGKYGE